MSDYRTTLFLTFNTLFWCFHEYARNNLFATHTENLSRRCYTVQYVKKVNFKRLTTFNVKY